MSRTKAVALAFALVLSAAVPAMAQTTASDSLDVLQLRDGTILRGHVTEIHPQRDLTMVLLTGEARNIHFDDVVTTAGPAFAPIGGSSGAVPSTSSAPAAPALPPPAPGQGTTGTFDPMSIGALHFDPQLQLHALLVPGPMRVPLVVDSRARLSLSAQLIGLQANGRIGGIWREVCTTPCTLYVYPGRFDLSSSGDSVAADSSVITVPPQGARVQLHAGSRGTQVASNTLGVIGFLGVLVGVPAAIVGIVEVAGGSSGSEPVAIGGGITFGIGTLMLVGALIIAARNPTGVQSITPLAAAPTTP